MLSEVSKTILEKYVVHTGYTIDNNSVVVKNINKFIILKISICTSTMNDEFYKFIKIFILIVF